MLVRAKQDFEAKQAALPPQPKSHSKSDLAKTLFPSSSPHSSATQDGNIGTLFKNSTRPLSSQLSASKPTAPTKPLNQRSVNIPSPPPRLGTGKGLVSLCSKPNAFTEEVEVIDLVQEDQKAKTIAGVYIEDDDFDDDATLDLDFDHPLALPLLPKAVQPKEKPSDTPPLSALSWSQSSPSHFQPSAPQANSSRRQSVKRESLHDSSSPLPIAKKRTMPKDWSKKPDSSTHPSLSRYGPSVTETPAPKVPPIWDVSASAVKAQKKQLKSQLKKLPTESEGPSLDEMRDITDSHALRTSSASVLTLSNEQRHVKSLVVEKNQSVFFTGPAGTGKSVLMRSIIDDLKRKHVREPDRIAVTASTGLAACNIGGMTLHSFAGIGLGKEDVQTLVKKIRRNPKAKNRWLRTKTLIIDEISMVDGELFDKLSQIGRIIRNNGRPWGGIQLVITGDFFQLPPVPDSGKQREAKFAFEASTWNTSIDHTIGLTEVFRQRDPVFAQMLNEMRLGQISEQTVQNFRSLNRPLHFDDGLEVTELFPTRHEVDSSNERRLRALPGTSYRYEAMDSGEQAVRDKLLQNMMAPKVLELKKGAQVMLIKNMDDTLVNGSLGIVTGFMSESTFDLLNGTGDIGSDVESDPKVKKRIQAFSNQLDASAGVDKKEYPLVRFHAVDGTDRIILCVPEEWKVELPTGEVQASRKQIPLILAWALSIHKAQGQTLERVKVDLGRVFEKGQAYVALSRATTQEGLQVLRFQKDKVMAHPRVVGFYNQLYSAEAAIKKKRVNASISNFMYKQDSARKNREDDEAMAAFG
ncbi:hypothetical protein VTK73DRAFT_878 [Phialemonium thermophilum]|uniref:ATP-dependent DNA helicase PIF1 n=1 Tax=Phialemonium thermophilum TaxID=223376 RepID=A0ABR3Y3X8_9PEZI